MGRKTPFRGGHFDRYRTIAAADGCRLSLRETGHIKNDHPSIFGKTVVIAKIDLTYNYRCVIMPIESSGSRQEGNRWRLAFTLPFYKRG